MKESISNKKNNVIVATISIIVVLLLTAVYLQGRQFSKYKERLDVNTLTENFETEIKAGTSSFEKSVLQDGEEGYKNKIAKLETKIAEMQGLQDHLEETLNKYDDRDDSAAWDQPEMDAVTKAKEDFNLRKNFLKHHIDFLEQNNYPPELNDKLFDLFIERNITLEEFTTDAQRTGFKNIRANAKELNRQIEEINAEYDEKTAELLSEDGLALYKEYEKRWMERSLILDFKDMLGDTKLEKEKERELIELMYKGRQSHTPLPYNFEQSYVFPENEPDAETVARLKKVKNENTRKTLDAYVESAEGILSESQLVIFKGIINSFKISLMPDDTAVNSSDEE